MIELSAQPTTHAGTKGSPVNRTPMNGRNASMPMGLLIWRILESSTTSASDAGVTGMRMVRVRQHQGADPCQRFSARRGEPTVGEQENQEGPDQADPGDPCRRRKRGDEIRPGERSRLGDEAVLNVDAAHADAQLPHESDASGIQPIGLRDWREAMSTPTTGNENIAIRNRASPAFSPQVGGFSPVRSRTKESRVATKQRATNEKVTTPGGQKDGHPEDS